MDSGFGLEQTEGIEDGCGKATCADAGDASSVGGRRYVDEVLRVTKGQ